MLLWPQPCGPRGRLYIGVSLAEPLFIEVEFWLQELRFTGPQSAALLHSVALDHLSSIVTRP